MKGKKLLCSALLLLFTLSFGPSLDGQKTEIRSFEYPKSFKKAKKRIEKLFQKDELIYSLKDESQTTLGKYIYHINYKEELLGYLFIGSTAACSFGGCADPEASNYLKASDDIHFYAILDSDRRILDMCITDFESQYGYEVAAKSWLKRFFGQKADESVEVDGITGATISSEAMLSAVKEIAYILD